MARRQSEGAWGVIAFIAIGVLTVFVWWLIQDSIDHEHRLKQLEEKGKK